MATSPPPLPPQTWPCGVNLLLLLVLANHCLRGGNGTDSVFVLALVGLTLAANVLGACLALLRRKWAVAAWYGLGLVVTLGLIGVVLMGVSPVTERPETLDE
jgi:hypothetical protein